MVSLYIRLSSPTPILARMEGVAKRSAFQQGPLPGDNLNFLLADLQELSVKIYCRFR
jgi:hypothetical protein